MWFKTTTLRASETPGPPPARPPPLQHGRGQMDEAGPHPARVSLRIQLHWGDTSSSTPQETAWRAGQSGAPRRAQGTRDRDVSAGGQQAGLLLRPPATSRTCTQLSLHSSSPSRGPRGAGSGTCGQGGRGLPTALSPLSPSTKTRPRPTPMQWVMHQKRAALPLTPSH